MYFCLGSNLSGISYICVLIPCLIINLGQVKKAVLSNGYVCVCLETNPGDTNIFLPGWPWENYLRYSSHYILTYKTGIIIVCLL